MSDKNRLYTEEEIDLMCSESGVDAKSLFEEHQGRAALLCLEMRNAQEKFGQFSEAEKRKWLEMLKQTYGLARETNS